MLSKNLLRQRGLYNSFRSFSAVTERPDVFMDIKGHGFLPNTKPMTELPKQFASLD